MPDDDPPDLSFFDFGEPSFTFGEDHSTNTGTIPNVASHSNVDAPQSYFDGDDWGFPNVSQANDFVSSTLAPATRPLGQTSGASWAQPILDQASFGALPSGVDPTVLFGHAVVSAEKPRLVGLHSPSSLQALPTMTPALQQELQNIAMPPNLRYQSPKSSSSPDSAIGASKVGSLSSPDAAVGSSKALAKKRKLSDDLDDDEELDEEGKPVKKSAHNMIEKRYRTNLNDKIAALRDSVPSLRIMSKSVRGEDTTGDREELHGLTPAHKLNKATVLSKATEYIHHLEKRNTRLLDENAAMQARISAFEKLFMAGAMNGSINSNQQPPTPMQYSHDISRAISSPLAVVPDTTATPAGMIEVPEDMKRILSAQMAVGRPYPVPQQPPPPVAPTLISQQHIQRQQQGQGGRWNHAGPYFGKLMVGSLAGLMILEAIREEEVSNENPEGRGLFALPLHWLGYLTSSSFDLHVMGYHIHTSLKLVLVIGTFLRIFVPSLFASPDEDPKKLQEGTLHPVPSLASSIHVRRQAWLTSIQSVWVPRHNIFLEASALMLKATKLSLRNAIGVHGYQVLSRATEDEEARRVQAWSIALDSQLAGGDVEVSQSRLVLTLLASGTLPDSPYRLMLKALHIRILLWDLSRSSLQLGVVNAAAAALARTRWNEARQLNRILEESRDDPSIANDDELPEHLAALVELECDTVLNADVLQRAHHLAFNRETAHDVETLVDGMDDVVNDSAIGSPMDAVAAWWSTRALYEILAVTLSDEEEHADDTTADVELAVKTAPMGSVAQVRATVARAVLVDKKRGANIASALQALGSDQVESPLRESMSIIESVSYSSDPDLRLALRCATAIGHLKRPGATSGTLQQSLYLGNYILMPNAASDMSLLGFTAAFELMEALFQNKSAREAFQPMLENLAATLRLWIGGPPGDKAGVGVSVRHKAADRCLSITKHLVGMEVDTGYGSMSDNEDDEN